MHTGAVVSNDVILYVCLFPHLYNTMSMLMRAATPLHCAARGDVRRALPRVVHASSFRGVDSGE